MLVLMAVCVLHWFGVVLASISSVVLVAQVLKSSEGSVVWLVASSLGVRMYVVEGQVVLLVNCISYKYFDYSET